MIEFFVALVFVQTAIILWAINRAISRIREDDIEYTDEDLEEAVKEILEEKQYKDQLVQQEQQQGMHVVARSVDDRVGTYKDFPIYRYVETDDGRTFVFESIAVEKFPGIYDADHTGKNYIIVDKCFLYREVTEE